MTNIELVQKIANEVCEDCGPNADCSEKPWECSRILNAIRLLGNYFEEEMGGRDEIK